MSRQHATVASKEGCQCSRISAASRRERGIHKLISQSWSQSEPRTSRTTCGKTARQAPESPATADCQQNYSSRPGEGVRMRSSMYACRIWTSRISTLSRLRPCRTASFDSLMSKFQQCEIYLIPSVCFFGQ